eukprot:TRINITY_DN18045_c0_g1_i1.p2 TRINITY_DN18045_c0_g1~~TRINITY_DN18045_c0_g1_i1.p2  ORF type:complete len:131 (-),score=36.37 TRINITY_DN18045_c0_g1_i1:165-557(-)
MVDTSGRMAILGMVVMASLFMAITIRPLLSSTVYEVDPTANQALKAAVLQQQQQIRTLTSAIANHKPSFPSPLTSRPSPSPPASLIKGWREFGVPSPSVAPAAPTGDKVLCIVMTPVSYTHLTLPTKRIV